MFSHQILANCIFSISSFLEPEIGREKNEREWYAVHNNKRQTISLISLGFLHSNRTNHDCMNRYLHVILM